jgi:hypothetical protein
MFPAPKAETWLLCMHTARTNSSTRNILIFEFVLDMVSVARAKEATAEPSKDGKKKHRKTQIVACGYTGYVSSFSATSTTHSTPQGRTGRPSLSQSSCKLAHCIVGRCRRFCLIFFWLIFCDFPAPHSPRHDFSITPPKCCSF